MTKSRIDTREELKRQTAKLGMVFWSLGLSQSVPDRERLLSLGLDVCDTVRELITAADRPTEYQTATYEEAAFWDRFCNSSERPRVDMNRLRENDILAKVDSVRSIIERLLHFENVSQEELEGSSQFCHLVYAAI